MSAETVKLTPDDLVDSRYGGDGIEPAPVGPLTNTLVLDPRDPLSIARRFTGDNYTIGGTRTLHFYRGEFRNWTGNAYPAMDVSGIRAQIYEYLEGTMQQGDNGLTRIKPKSRLVSEVLDALKAVAYLNEGIDPPAWLDGSEGRPAPSRILPLANGLLDIETRRLLSHSPEYFNMAGLDVDYVPEAVDAVEWENFLDSLWPDDREAKDALQEIFGYLLTTDVRQQKLFGSSTFQVESIEFLRVWSHTPPVSDVSAFGIN